MKTRMRKVQVLQWLAFLETVHPPWSNGDKIDGTELVVPNGTMVPLLCGPGTKIICSNLFNENCKIRTIFSESELPDECTRMLSHPNQWQSLSTLILSHCRYWPTVSDRRSLSRRSPAGATPRSRLPTLGEAWGDMGWGGTAPSGHGSPLSGNRRPSRIHHHQAASNAMDYMGPPVRPCRRPQLQKPRTSRARRVLGAAAMDATEADGGVTTTSGAGIQNQPCIL
jgi:hypothetical protein